MRAARALQDARAHPTVRPREAGGERRSGRGAGQTRRVLPGPGGRGRAGAGRTAAGSLGRAAGEGARQPQGGALVGTRTGRRPNWRCGFGAALWRFWHQPGLPRRGGGVAGASGTRMASRQAAPYAGKGARGDGMAGAASRAITIGRERTYEEMLELSRELGDKGNVATALNSLGTMAVQQGDNERARVLLQENLAGDRGTGGRETSHQRSRGSMPSTCWGTLAINEEGDYARATTLWEQSLALAREVGDDRSHRDKPDGAWVCSHGARRLREGAEGSAKRRWSLPARITRERGWFVPEALVNKGLAGLGQGEHERAAASFSKGLGGRPRDEHKAERHRTAWRGWPAWREPQRRPLGRHACGGPWRPHEG